MIAIRDEIVVVAVFVAVMAAAFTTNTIELSPKEYEATLSYSVKESVPTGEDSVSELVILDASVTDFRNDLIQTHPLLVPPDGNVVVTTFCDGELVDRDLRDLQAKPLQTVGDRVELNNLRFGADCRAVIHPEFGSEKEVSFKASPLAVDQPQEGDSD